MATVCRSLSASSRRVSVSCHTLLVVSKSKGRKPKKKPVRPVARTVPSIPFSVPGQYAVGRLRGSDKALGALLFSGQAAPDLMVELLLPLLWLYHADGNPANMCVDSALTLHYAYEQLGIIAQPRAVDLVVADERTSKKVYYGRPDPQWQGSTFLGHCVLWLPRSRRFIDATVEQYPEIRRYRLGPICGRIAVAEGRLEHQAALDRGELPAGTHLGVQRKELTLMYTAVDQRFDDVVTTAPVVQHNVEKHRRTGINLASHAISMLRLPEVSERIRRAPYPRLHALLDVIGTADITADEDGDFRIALPNPDGVELSLRLDEIALPAYALVPDAPELLFAAIPYTTTDPQELQAALEDTTTEARAVLVADQAMGGGPLPVLLFEPLRAVAIRTVDGRTREMQTEGIIKAGFARFLPDVDQPPPLLTGWSVRLTGHSVELWDQGGLWARATLPLEETWRAAAAAHGTVRVIYGAQTGVRTPAGFDAAAYDAVRRGEDLSTSRRQGIVAVAYIPWTP